MRTALATIALCLAAGCGTNALIVKPGDPVRLSQDVTIHQPYVWDGKQFVRSANDWTGGAGWFLIPPPAATRPAK